MVIDILFSLIFEALLALGVYVVTDSGKILHCPAVWLTSILQKWMGDKSKYITYPLYDCIGCMGSFWGAVVFVSFHNEWHLLPLFMLAASGANVVLYNIYEKSNEL